MNEIDWNAPARLNGREPGGLQGQHGAAALREGSVRELVHHVATLSAEHRAGLVLEVAGGATLEVGEILDLAAREDLGE